MLKAVEKFNEEIIIPEGRPPVGMGAGINTGLGYHWRNGFSTKRHSYDVLGDAVSTAARVESNVKNMDVAYYLLEKNTYKQTKDDFFYLKVDDLQVKGKSVGLGIYTVLDDAKPVWASAQKKSRIKCTKIIVHNVFDDAIDKCRMLRMIILITRWKATTTCGLNAVSI